MTLETTPEGELNAPIQTDEQFFSSLRSTSEPEPPAEIPAEAPPEPVAPAVEEPNELEILKRTVAMDPALRAAYAAQKFGVPMEQLYQPPAPPPVPQQQHPQPVQQQPQQPQQVDPAQLFGEEGYDPYNPAHQAMLVNYQLQQALQPFSQYIGSLQQQEQQVQQQQQVQLINNLNSEVQDLVDSHVPGFKQVAMGQNLSLEQQMFVQAAQNQFQQKLFSGEYPPGLIFHQDPAVRKKVYTEVIGRLAPQLQQLGTKLGLTQASPAPQVNPTRSREAYVESSNAVPTQSPDALRQAVAKKDDVAVFGMLRQMSRQQ